MPKERDSKSNQAAAQSRSSRLRQPQVWIPASVFAVAMLFLILFRVEGQPFQWKVDARDWTGFGQSYDNNVSEVTEKGTETTGTTTKKIDKTTTTAKRLQPAKTLWDWMPLLPVPLTLAGLGFWFQCLQEKAKGDKEEADKARVADQQREQALQSYFDQLSALLVDKQLKKLLPANQACVPTKMAQPELLIDAEAALDVVKARTLSLLRMFDEDIPRKASVLSFLADADLLKQLDLDLSGIRLEGANLRRVNLSACQLYGAKLQGANLHSADLRGASLVNADLRGAELSFAKLNGAYLDDADLRGAFLGAANLRGAKLSFAKLSGAYLDDANLSDVRLRCADLSNASLRCIDFSNASLRCTVLSGTDLSNTVLNFANLSFANLSGANLNSVYLNGADFSFTNFWDSKLTGSDLDRAKKDAVVRIQSAKNWQKAYYDPEMRELLGLPPETSEAEAND